MDERPVDLEVALRWLGGDRHLLLELVDLFVEDIPKRVIGLREASTTLDVHEIERLAHSLKGSAAILGATGVQAAALTLEEAMRARQGVDASGRLADLARELERVAAYLADPSVRAQLTREGAR